MTDHKFTVDVSVVIPTFRREQLVPEAIRSALSQTGVTLEVIVVDDSGVASAREVVRTIEDPRLRYIARAKPGGNPAVPRNDGAAQASGRYVHFLDDDDLLEPGALAALAGALDANPRAGMAFGNTTPFGEDPRELQLHEQYYREALRVARALRSNRELVANLVFHPAILVNSACMARRETFVAAGGYDSTLPVAEDVDLWGRLARLSGGYVFVDQPVMRYRTGAPSIMHGSNMADKLLVSYQRMQQKYREAHGALEYLVMKLWARTLLRRRTVQGGSDPV
jgi:glycosyltransferase involved in cell wall biosynthesis